MTKIIRDDGSVTYYYYKKKKGRHKKTGPKKKKKKRGSLNQEKWDFKILQFDFKKQVGYVGKYHNVGEVETKKKELLLNNSNVEFPVMYVNNNRKSKKIYDYESEYVVLKRNFDNVETTLIRNDYGKFVNNWLKDKNWVIYDKFKHLKEETFWVYGYNPRTDRKTYRFIYEIFVDKVIDNTYNLIQVYIYNNKVIFRYEYDKIEFVICKNTSDAIRMYNLLEEKYKKTKQVFFTGFTNSKDDRANEIINIIHEKTGWDYKKIYKKTTNE